MAACLEPNLRTDAFFITRSLACQAYGRCHCRAGKKPAFWINPTGSSPSHPEEHSLPGGTGHLVGTEFTSSISRVIPICHTQDHSYLDSNETTRIRTVNVCRWQVHFVCSKRNPAIQHHVGEKLPLKSSKTERSSPHWSLSVWSPDDYGTHSRRLGNNPHRPDR